LLEYRSASFLIIEVKASSNFDSDSSRMIVSVRAKILSRHQGAFSYGHPFRFAFSTSSRGLRVHIIKRALRSFADVAPAIAQHRLDRKRRFISSTIIGWSSHRKFRKCA
jgi:hypothetical protein